MPCVHPIPARRKDGGGVTFITSSFHHDEIINSASNPTSDLLLLPCGSCIGCRKSRAREWALRCTLERDSHDRSCWSTLTYSDEKLPPTLRKNHLSLFFRTLRKRLAPTRVRFFASGEYGEQTQRPHYHAILYGIDESSLPVVEAAWPHGHAQVDSLSPGAISYVAGYCSKKLGFYADREERIDYATGEVYLHEPPFVHMSRNPGIGSDARRFINSWRDHAVHQGFPIPVPRYLHNSWQEASSLQDRALLEQEKTERAKKLTTYTLKAQELHLGTLHNLSAQRRNTL